MRRAIYILLAALIVLVIAAVSAPAQGSLFGVGMGGYGSGGTIIIGNAPFYGYPYGYYASPYPYYGYGYRSYYPGYYPGYYPRSYYRGYHRGYYPYGGRYYMQPYPRVYIPRY